MIWESQNKRLQFMIMLILDIVCFNFAATAGDYFGIYTLDTLFILILVVLWPVILLFSSFYQNTSEESVKEIFVNLAKSYLILGIVIFFLHGFLQSSRYLTVFPTSEDFILLCLITSGCMLSARFLVKFIYKYIEFQNFKERSVIILGTGKSAQALCDFFTSGENGQYNFMGYFDDNPLDGISKFQYRGPLDKVKEYAITHRVDEIYFALPQEFNYLLTDLKRFADQNTIYLRYAPDFYQILDTNYNISIYNSIPVLTTRKEPLTNPLNLLLKRTFDVIFSLLVILVIFPWLLPIVAFAIKLESPGPVFFKQLRPGKKNRLFECYKFRTMRVNNETEKQAVRNDPRVTRVGKFLRKTSIDEFPQFFNVLIGNMSVVGPRPNMISQLEEFSQTIENYKSRHFITPGITGLAQISGYRGETNEPELMKRRVECDLNYLENWSFYFDIKIILYTIRNIFVGDQRAF